MNNLIAVNTAYSRTFNQMTFKQMQLYNYALMFLSNRVGSQFESELSLTVTFSMDDFLSHYDIQIAKPWRYMRTLIKEMIKVTTTIETDIDTPNEAIHAVTMFTILSADKATGRIKLLFNPFFAQYAFHLSHAFDIYNIDELKTLQSRYSYRLHSWLNSHYCRQQVKENTFFDVTITTTELTTMLESPTKYAFPKLNDKVIQPFINQINNSGYWFVHIKTHFTAGKISSVTFHAKKRNNYEAIS